MALRRSKSQPDTRALFTKRPDKNESPILELKDVARTYGETAVPVPALRGVSMKVARREMVAIMGPSGSGKTTLLNMIGLLDTPDSGQVIYRGEDVTKLKRKRLSTFRQVEIGFVFQQKHLLPTLTALENVSLPFRYLKGDRNIQREQALEALRLVDMADRADHRPAQLSGGQQQRVALARALVLSPAVILADEPTGELDSKTGDAIVKLMRQLNETTGQTFVIVTHNDHVAEACDRIVRMQDGKILPARKN